MAQFAIDEILTTGIAISGFVFDVSNNIGTNGYVLTSTSSGVMWQQDSNSADLSALSGQIAATGSLLNNRINSLSGYANNTFLSGSGVANYVARWSNTKELITGSIYDLGTGVGIGTTSPAAKLNVYGGNTIFRNDIAAGASAVFIRNWAANPTTSLTFGNSPDDDSSAALDLTANVFSITNYGDPGSFIKFGTRNDSTADIRVTIDPSGRVGIGAANPSTLLVVGGAGSTSAASGITFGADSQANLYRISSSRIKTDGNFTIDGQGGGATSLVLNRSSTSSENGMAFNTAGSTDWYFYVDNSSSNLQIQRSSENDAAPRVRFDGANSNILFNLGGGNVGIGTANPNTKLRISGSFSQRASGTTAIQEYKNITTFNYDGYSNGGYVVKTPFRIGSTYEMSIVHVKGYGYGGSTLYDFKVVFYDYEPSNAPINYSIVDLGNDGSPKYLAKDSNNYIQVCFGQTGDVNYYYRFTVDCITTRYDNDFSQGWGMYQTTGANFGFASTGIYQLNSPLNFRTNLNVGLGTTNPQNKLSVIGSVNIGSNNFNTAAPTNGLIIEGNVGIGLTNPVTYINGDPTSFRPNPAGKFLDIYSSANEANINLITNNSGDGSGIGGLYFTRARGQSDNHYQIAAIKGLQDGTNGLIAGGKLYFYTKQNGSNTLLSSPAMVINSNADVGIGITQPGGRLHVSGSNGHVLYLNQGVTGAQGGLYFQNVDQFALSSARLYFISGDSVLFTRGPSSLAWAVSQNANVGIGVTNPSEKLTITGAVKILTRDGANFKVGDGSNNNTFLEFDYPDISTSNAYFRIFRNTNTVGGKYFQIFKGDGTATSQTLLNANGDSHINAIAGNLGIGTDTPNHLLNLSTVTSDTSIGLYTTTSNTSARNWLISANDLAYGDFSLRQSLAISGNPRTSGVSRFYINNNGNVGIATTSPGYSLQIGQNASGNNIDYSLGILRHGTLTYPGSWTSNPAFKIIDLSDGGPSNVDIYGLINLELPRFQASDTNAEKASLFLISFDTALGPFRIDGKGNTWVGYDRVTTGTNLSSFSTLIYGGLAVGDNYQTTTLSNGQAIFQGNVGIGVTNPGVKLQVVNTGSITSTSTIRIVGATGNGGGSQIEFFKGTSQKFSIGTASAITGGFSDDLLLTTLNPSSIILTAGLSGLAIFKTDGKVGIGMYNPISLLSIGGSGSTSPASGITFGLDSQANLYRSAEGTVKTDGSLIIGTDLYVADELGVGVPIANKRFNYGAEVEVTNASIQLVLGRLGNATGQGAIGADSSNVFAVWNVSGGLSKPFVITQQGNVGIGYDTPSYKLEVNGNASFTKEVYFQNQSFAYFYGRTGFANKGTILFNNGSAQNLVFGEIANDIYSFGPGASGAAPTSNTLTLNNANISVGIGTSAPTYQLTVIGANQATANLTDAGVKGGSILVASSVNASNQGGAVLFATKNDGNTYTPQSAIKSLFQNGNGYGMGDLAFSSRLATGDTNLTEVLRIKYDGKVGIGTTNPNEKLEVQGNIQIGNDSVTNVGLKLTRLNGGIRTSEHTYHSSQNSPWYTYGQNLTWTNELAGTVESTQAYRPYIEAFAPIVGYKIFGFMNVTTGSFTSANLVNSLVLKNDGNVGIGLTNPQRPLDVLASSNDFVTVGARTLAVGQFAGIHFGYREDNNSYRKSAIVFERTDRTSSNAQGKVHILNGPIVGAGNATLADAKFTIDESGNIGIGTTVPTGRLHIVGNDNKDNGPVIRLGGSNVNQFEAGRIRFNESAAVGYQGAYVHYNGIDNIFNIGVHDNTDSIVANDTNAISILRSNAYVGIGTTNPIYNLDVVGPATANGVTLRLRDAASLADSRHILITRNAVQASIGIAGSQTNDPLWITRSSGYDLMIDLNGKVGIGTNNPTTLLSVGGAGSTTAASGITFGSDAQANLYRTAEDTLRTDGALIAGNYLRALSYVQFLTNLYPDSYGDNVNINIGNLAGNSWETAIKVKPGSYVGIGTTQPTGKLHVVSNVANETVLRIDGTNGTLLSVVDDLTDSLFSVNNGAGLPVLEVFADDRVVAGQYGSGDFVLANNKIGIGTTNPVNKLSVIGAASIGSNSYNTVAPTNGLIIEGNVGIGTTSPAYKLDVYASSVEMGRIYNNQTSCNINIGSSNNSLYTDLTLLTSNGNAQFFKNASNTNWGGANSLNIYTSNGAIALHPAGYQNALYLATNGNIGIGINNPLQKLQVDGTVGNPASGLTTQSGIFRISNTTDNAVLDFGIRAAGNGAWIQSTDETDLSANYPLLLNPNGANVGIGTSSPLTVLDVRYKNTSNAASQVAGMTLRTNQNGGLEWHLSQSSNSYVGWVAGARVNSYGGNWGQGYLEFITAGAGGAVTSTMTLNSGYVGIGTTSPVGSLHVEGNFVMSRVSVLNSSKFSINGDGTNPIFSLQLNSTTATVSVIDLYNAGGTNFAAIKGDTSNKDLTFNVGPSSALERVRINSTGYVGIGTNGPVAQLHIGGSATNNNPWAVLDINDTYFKRIVFSEERLGYGTLVYGGYIGYDAAANTVSLGTYNNSTEYRSLNILRDNGYVGIGTTQPLNRLSVISSNSTNYYNATAPVAVFQGVSPSTVLIAVDGNVDGYFSELRLGNAQSTYYPYSAYVRGIQGAGIDYYRMEFGTSNGSAATTRMTIANNGNIGIGLTNTTDKIQISGGGISFTTSTGLAVPMLGLTALNIAYVGPYATSTDGNAPSTVLFNHGASVQQTWFYSSGRVAMVLNKEGRLHIGNINNTPNSLLSVGPSSSTTAVSGMCFGNDASANWYRSATATIKTDGDLIVVGNVTAANLVSGSGATNYITKWNGTKSITTGQIFDDGTYVGINTITNTTYRLQVNGSFAATTKSFDITHPTISGKRLVYASLEGPENGVYFRGRNNNNEINLPHYWSGLVHDDSITVDLTSIGKRKDGRIRNYSVDQIGHNKVYIYTDSDDNIYDYYYTIFAERKDVSKLVIERDME